MVDIGVQHGVWTGREVGGVEQVGLRGGLAAWHQGEGVQTREQRSPEVPRFWCGKRRESPRRRSGGKRGASGSLLSREAVGVLGGSDGVPAGGHPGATSVKRGQESGGGSQEGRWGIHTGRYYIK